MVKRWIYLSFSILVAIFPIVIVSTLVEAASKNIRQNINRISEQSSILIYAVLYDGYELNDADEAVAFQNLQSSPVNLQEWGLFDKWGNGAIFSDQLIIAPGEIIWVANDKYAFKRQFGFLPDAALDPWPGFANGGDSVNLLDDQQKVVDVLVYEQGQAAYGGWIGPSVMPYTVPGVFGAEGQILYRKLDQTTALPVADTNKVEDWAQDRQDVINGRKVHYPGWNLPASFFTMQVTETAVLTVAIAPDNAYETLVGAISKAKESIYIESLTAENLAIADTLSAAANNGVEVILMLEGSPPGGISNQEKYFCQKLEGAGGQCWFMISDSDERIQDRYRYLHSKFFIFDQRIIALSSENLSYNSLPFDDKVDGTWGRRGVILMTDAPTLVEKLGQIFEDDFDPSNHVDLFRWQQNNQKYGAPSAGFIPLNESGGITYQVKFPNPAVFEGKFSFELQQAPENSMRTADGLLGLLAKAERGDVILMQQLFERPHWGPSGSNRIDDPNPRLEMAIAAARRGAKVNFLLDEFFDDKNSPLSNHATCNLLNQLAQAEELDLSCSVANPTGLGIHNKMVLAHIAGRGYIFLGSINGSELSHKGNRELALMTQSTDAYYLLAEMLTRDTPHILTMPVIFNSYYGAPNHLLISEVLYDPYGDDQGEFIELVNPTSEVRDLSGFSISDAVNKDDFEDLQRFPAGTMINPGAVLVIATSAQYFWDEYGFWPDFEILETVQAVPNLIDDKEWGSEETFLRLGNNGDEVIMRNKENEIIDALAFGTGAITGFVSCQPVSGTNHSLERFPYWRDSDNCVEDFRDWAFPSPGVRSQ